MIDRNKIAYKIRFYTDSTNNNKIYNNVTKEFEPICYNTFCFNYVKVTDCHIILADSNCSPCELGFNVIGEIIDNPNNIPFKLNYNFNTIKMNNFYDLHSNMYLTQEFKAQLNDILKTDITNVEELRKLCNNHFVLTNYNIIDKFVDIYFEDSRTGNIEDYLDKDKCLEYILDNVIFFLKPFNNFNDNEYYLVIEKDRWQ